MNQVRSPVLWLLVAICAGLSAFVLQRLALERTPSPDCNQATAQDLVCAIERDWRAQDAARAQGTGVVLQESCGLARNFKWPVASNERQKRYQFDSAVAQSIDSAGTEVRIEVVRDDGGSHLAYEDVWRLTDGRWQSVDCFWGKGSPSLGYLPVVELRSIDFDSADVARVEVEQFHRPTWQRLRW
jgi:hypothetical protein